MYVLLVLASRIDWSRFLPVESCHPDRGSTPAPATAMRPAPRRIACVIAVVGGSRRSGALLAFHSAQPTYPRMMLPSEARRPLADSVAIVGLPES